MSDEVIQWLRKAREDLTVARHEMALPDEETVTAAVCFHCQQFVEKVFKAFLVLHGVAFPRTHNIEYLKELCAKSIQNSRLWMCKTFHSTLSRFATLETIQIPR
jgi:HEPN domain-containing protein